MGLWRVHVQVADRPGQLAELAAAVGRAGCNIVSLTVLGERGPDGEVTDELLVDATAAAAADLPERIRAAGMGCTLARAADAGELRDPVTTALAVARRVTGDPDAAPRALASLLHARLADSAGGEEYTHEMRVLGREVWLRRAWPFTATELSRAAVLAELAEQAAVAATGHPDPEQGANNLGLVLLGNGSEVELRVAGPADAPLVAALHARCTPSTRRGRFLNPSPTLSTDELTALLVGRNGAGMALLALTTDGGHAVGIASVDPDHTGDHPTQGALGVLVEDAWQARGVGTALIRRTVELATELGYTAMTASAHPGNLRITRLLRRSGLRPTAQLVDGLLQIHVHLEPRETAISTR
ncbi:hypothetical protein GCM10023321_03930 [Pseudonocardia eucalypti]|uniref:GNAT family N-acetyltransferase n=1 Tax=Pseudonocardia eucalypti TaxID=648755 RepID=A0ABP9PII0_9PSEU|nr:RimJ/RimL family protein N-acetyltransferase [Pseudonocardia eucalypti]